jgi:hypothetical protein
LRSGPAHCHTTIGSIESSDGRSAAVDHPAVLDRQGTIPGGADLEKWRGPLRTATRHSADAGSSEYNPKKDPATTGASEAVDGPTSLNRQSALSTRESERQFPGCQGQIIAND